MMTVIKMMREQQGLPEKYMAKACKISKSSYHLYEKGERSIPVKIAEIIARELKCEKEALFKPLKYEAVKLK